MVATQRGQSALWLPTILLVAIGCSSRVEHFPVQGTVTLGNGQPLSGGTISLESSDGRTRGRALIGSDGRFAIKSGQGEEGLPAGVFRALILPASAPDPDRPLPTKFANKYTRYETSGLEFTIDGPVEDLQVKLER